VPRRAGRITVVAGQGARGFAVSRGWRQSGAVPAQIRHLGPTVRYAAGPPGVVAQGAAMLVSPVGRTMMIARLRRLAMTAVRTWEWPSP
jgi:hypothetical protein